MVFSKMMIACFIAIAAATQLHTEDGVFAALLKRQAPGTPSYNCHDNCGTAITLSRQPNKCDLDAFKTNYNNCLQCAGPDNYNIWRMYGNTLSSAGSSCGLSTEPLPGKQPDVGPAVHTGSSSAAASATASGTSAPVSGSAAASMTQQHRFHASNGRIRMFSQRFGSCRQGQGFLGCPAIFAPCRY